MTDNVTICLIMKTREDGAAMFFTQAKLNGNLFAIIKVSDELLYKM